MVGLVIVSHSRALALALKSLLKATSSDKVQIGIAGGVGKKNDDFGTDATDVLSAIESVYSEDGVLILADMGSALLSSELALDFLDEKTRQRVKISPAPIVEGGLSAAVQISLNAPLQQVYEEAALGLIPKQTHLGVSVSHTQTGIPQNFEDDPKTLKKTLIIANTHGLHARPLARLVQTAGRFSALVGVKNLTKNTAIADAHSLTSLALLQARQGDRIMILAQGSDAAEALQSLVSLHESKYGETAEPVQNQASKKQTALSQGYALATAFILPEHKINVKKAFVKDTAMECLRFTNAVKAAKIEILQSIDALKNSLSAKELDIFYAQTLLLDDPALINDSLTSINKDKYTADYAWYMVIKSMAQQYAGMNDQYFQMRASDIMDIGIQVLKNLGLDADMSFELPDKHSILFAKELSPRYAALLSPSNIAGVVIEQGGSTSHAAIIIRSLGIPAITGFTDWAELKDGSQVILDGYDAKVFVNPSTSLYKEYEKKYAAHKEKEIRLRADANKPAQTKNGQRVLVQANIGSLAEAKSVGKMGADGVGLLRTEFLFLNRENPPSEEEQYKLLRDIFVFAGKPVTLRTLDIGGDKPLPYLRQKNEANPFLGLRGIRLYKQERVLFSNHLRAVLRAAAGHEVKIMFPMVATLDDFTQARKEIEKMHKELQKAGIVHKWPIDIGAMIETPAAAILAAELAQVCDFFSIGTNDLTQYLMAAERGNTDLLDYTNPLNPAMLRCLTHIISEADKANCPVSLCGEPGPLDPALKILFSIGLRNISLNLSRIPEAKEYIRQLDGSENFSKNFH